VGASVVSDGARVSGGSTDASVDEVCATADGTALPAPAQIMSTVTAAVVSANPRRLATAGC